jgi:hypothetical protein
MRCLCSIPRQPKSLALRTKPRLMPKPQKADRRQRSPEFAPEAVHEKAREVRQRWTLPTQRPTMAT